jgi:hypothetical protein
MAKSKNPAYGQYVSEQGKVISDIKGYRLLNPGAKVFQSMLEYECYKFLEKAGLNFTWQPETVELAPSFSTWSLSKSKTPKIFKATVRNITYTSDFKITSFSPLEIYIEVKGFFQPDARMRYKLFQAKLKSNQRSFIIFSVNELKVLIELLEKDFLKQQKTTMKLDL